MIHELIELLNGNVLTVGQDDDNEMCCLWVSYSCLRFSRQDHELAAHQNIKTHLRIAETYTGKQDFLARATAYYLASTLPVRFLCWKIVYFTCVYHTINQAEAPTTSQMTVAQQYVPNFHLAIQSLHDPHATIPGVHPIVTCRMTWFYGKCLHP